ncbi:MAG: hypothetical protein ACTSRW_09385 [Candidatus Helarchaeota archaeon]
MLDLLTTPNPIQNLHILFDTFLAISVVTTFVIMIVLFYISLFKPDLKKKCYVGLAIACAFFIMLLVSNYVWPLFFGFPI